MSGISGHRFIVFVVELKIGLASDEQPATGDSLYFAGLSLIGLFFV